ncbi:hypothetical protein GCM10010435_00560 [Winogradskya consettensis]|uniref:DUF218 domain-containing protein n=1 Tax=Winogradskya consettensis TaxID=113560 RepID=A0A919S9Z6_9ACTN|nr:ElyC/SanA/YdcF family protein [Actinoplanes consettensis]GIM66520.1 hypothetical protein Aco04nite_02390 [Actinoplanes consettensis]
MALLTWVRRPFARRLIVAGSLVVAASVLAMAAGGIWVTAQSQGHVYAVSTVPAAPVALVLGTEVYDDGTPSPFLEARLELARQLFTAGKVKAILVSGDHRVWEYNEPGAMFAWLVAHGVPSRSIALDHAGFDTYDSCARAKEVFGVTSLTVVTQSYHIDRAVAVCRALGLNANGVGDDSVRAPHWNYWYNTAARERPAAVKALLDVASGRDPVFLGPHETSVDEAVAS